MLVVATTSECHMLVNKVGGSTKAVIEDGAFFNRVKDTNNDANSIDMDKVAIAGGPKREVDIWSMLIIVIASGKSTQDLTFILVPIIDIGLVSVSIIGMA